MPVTNVGSLVGELGLDTSNFNKNLDKASGRVENQAKSWNSRFTNISQRLGAIGKNLSLKLTAPMLALGAGVFALTNRIAANANEIFGLTSAFGGTVQFWQRLVFAAKSFGLSMDEFLSVFSRINDTARLSPEVFENIGISVRDAAGNLRGPIDIFLDLVDVLSGIEDQAARAELGSQLFGEQWVRIAPFITAGKDELTKLGDEAERTGAVLEEETLKTLADTALEFEKLRGQITKFTTDALVPLITAFTNLTKPMQTILVGLVALLFIAGPLVAAASIMSAAFAGLSTVIAFLVANPIALLILALAGLIVAIVLLWTQWDNCTDLIMEKTGRWGKFIVAVIKDLIIATGIGGVVFATKHLVDTWEEDWNTMLAILDAAGRWITARLDDIINMINRVINAWNSLTFRVPRISLPGGGSFGGQSFGVPQLPTIPNIPSRGTSLSGQLEGGGQTTFDLRGAFIADGDSFRRVIAREGAEIIRGGGWPNLRRT